VARPVVTRSIRTSLSPFARSMSLIALYRSLAIGAMPRPRG